MRYHVIRSHITGTPVRSIAAGLRRIAEMQQSDTKTTRYRLLPIMPRQRIPKAPTSAVYLPAERRKPEVYAKGYMPLEPFGYWHWDYEKEARREGWLLTNDSDDRVTISRIDFPDEVPECKFKEPRFASDMAAQEFVITKAFCTQSHMHMLALYLLGHPLGELLNMDVPDVLLHPELAARKKRARRSRTS